MESLDNMHKSVRGTLSNSRKEAVDRHNKRTGVLSCNLSVGDYVVVVARNRGPRTKLSANWVGPHRIVQARSDYVFRVQHLITQETEDTHVSRINRYAAALIGTSVQMEEIAEFSDRVWYSVSKIQDTREENESFKAFISWKGL